MDCKQREERCLDALNLARMHAEQFATSCAEQHKSYAHGIYDIIGMAAIVLILTVVLWKMAEDRKWWEKLLKFIEQQNPVKTCTCKQRTVEWEECSDCNKADQQPKQPFHPDPRNWKIDPPKFDNRCTLGCGKGDCDHGHVCEGCHKTCSKSEIVDYNNVKLCVPCHKILLDLERKCRVPECDGCKRTGVKMFMVGPEGSLCNTCYDKENNSKLGEAKHQVQQQN